MKFYNTNNIVSEEYIKENETKMGFIFPNDYKNFLLRNNGGSPEKKVINFKEHGNNQSTSIDYLFGFTDISHRDILKHYWFSYRTRIPANTFPIARDPGSNLLLISLKGDDYGHIYFWNHNWEADEDETPDYSNMSLVANSFTDLLNNLKDESEIDDQ